MHAVSAVPCPVVPRLAAVRNLVQARQAFQALEAWLMREETRQLPLHEGEREQERRGREIQRLLLEAPVAQRGTGDVGPAVEVRAADSPGAGALHVHRRLDPRHPQTIFGEITVERTGYGHTGAATVHPLDAQWQLPHRSCSYELQRRLVQAAVQGPFDEATARDGQGVPIVKAEPARRVVRRAKGEKAQQKKMAVVATVYTQQPRLRGPQAVFEPRFRLGPVHCSQPAAVSPPRERPEYKRVWASLLKGKTGIMAEVVEELRRRDSARQKRWVVLTDGERALPQSVKRRLRGVPLVLDCQHVLAKLWTAAYAFHEDGSPKALAWVQERAWRLLHGEVSQVVQGMRLSATTRQLRGQKRKVVEAVAGYFSRNRGHRHYHEYLRQGWPIATGVVEGACKNVVKDRMERSGMRWTPAMAEAMLKLQAVYLSDDFEAYWAFHIAREHERLHPPGSWRPAHIIEEK